MATIQELIDRVPITRAWAVYNTYSDRYKECWSGVVVRECTVLRVAISFRNKDGTFTGPTDYCAIRKHDKYQNEAVIKAKFLFFDEDSAQNLAAALREELAEHLAQRPE